MLLARSSNFNSKTSEQDNDYGQENSDGEENNSSDELGEALYKHPLEHTWTLWYLENDRSKCWEDMQNEITSFDMVEDFWSLYNHIKQPSEIKIGSDYSLFKKGIQPMWEDKSNKSGGRWVITLTRCSKQEVDKAWLDIVLMLIGESFEHSDDICGAVINIRTKGNKISIWNSDGKNEVSIMEIGLKLRDYLTIPALHLQYQLHKDSMTTPGSLVKALFTL